MITFKPLWITLAQKEMKRTELLKVVSSQGLAKMGKNEMVSLGTLNKICELLDCSIQDVIAYERDLC